MATSMLIIVPQYDISQLSVGPRVCQLDFSCVVPPYIFENAPDNFFFLYSEIFSY